MGKGIISGTVVAAIVGIEIIIDHMTKSIIGRMKVIIRSVVLVIMTRTIRVRNIGIETGVTVGIGAKIGLNTGQRDVASLKREKDLGLTPKIVTIVM